MKPLPEAVRRLLDAQFGLVARRQLVAAALSADQVDGWVRHGRLERVHRGVYRVPDAPVPDEQAVMAATLYGGDDALAGPFASCALHRLEGFILPECADVTVGFGQHRSYSLFRLHHARVTFVDRTSVSGVPCLTPARALIEVAPSVDRITVRRAIDSARRRGLVSPNWLRRRALDLDAGHPGAMLMRELIASGDLDKESEGEREILEPFLLPLHLALEYNVAGVVPGRRLDAFERETMLGFEYDGRDHHVYPTDRDADGLRDLDVLVTGVQVVRITLGMVRDAPEQTLRGIQRLRTRRIRDLARHEPTSG